MGKKIVQKSPTKTKTVHVDVNNDDNVETVYIESYISQP